MVMELRRGSGNSLISDQIFFFDGWKPEHPKTDIGKTVNSVTYLQERGRLEWVAPVTFRFTDLTPSSTIEDMYTLIRLARRREWLEFTDKFGEEYDVRVKNAPLVPERDEDSPLDAIFFVEAHLLARGYE